MTSGRMRLVNLASVPDNATLAHDVHIPGVEGPPLLRRGVVLNDRYLGALRGKKGLEALRRETERRALGKGLSVEEQAIIRRAVAIEIERRGQGRTNYYTINFIVKKKGKP